MSSGLLESSVVGEKYRVSGESESGKNLYQLTEEELADLIC